MGDHAMEEFRLTVLLVDAFTRTPGRGNRAGVVLDAAGLSAAAMQAVAALVNVSETAFILPAPAQAGYAVHVRYFTPRAEVPVCGHATVGAHYARARALGISDTTVSALTGAGVLPVDIRGSGRGMKIVMTQGRVVFSPPCIPAVRQAVLNALGLDEDDLLSGLPVQEVSTGHSKIMVPLRRTALLDALKPDMTALTECSRVTGCNGFFVFGFNGGDDEALINGRMFAPAIGIDEDPVTGNANGPCGAYLSHYGRLPAQAAFTFCGRQGVAMGKEGMVEVTVHRDEDGPCRVQVGGHAAEAGRMEVALHVEDDGRITARSV
ncbi:PhzF family isomerase [Oleidesulfovibrio alaskensis]|jgi:PhzF family phenazine biosynthesis protein|nr:PhzF family isomerase [Oleidesulfovibrio alaskensis]